MPAREPETAEALFAALPLPIFSLRTSGEALFVASTAPPTEPTERVIYAPGHEINRWFLGQNPSEEVPFWR